MAGHWPDSDHPSAQAVNGIPKVLFSRTLNSAGDRPETRIAGGDTADQIAKPGRNP
ncbi:hypothetical protein BKA00_005944 [Actinomadura coerulea]|uniref:Uncharacterized protein n=1 Tax=Actinomadura coerulea TaxID=46159 RepID=A0A7X0L1Y9_9ACTN|nr:hypothetical protein [Actinomadura coerulea]MBB6399030.1 hypothetical protein [Actinomadura coerulea]